MTVTSFSLDKTSGPGISALDGITVVDISTGVAGGYCTMMLAAFGATVIKIEAPGTGDHLRQHGPFADPSHPLETGVLHLYLNAGKASVTLDTACPTGRAILAELLQHADVLVDDAEPGHLDTLGLDVATREARYPKLVTTLLTAFGQDGPYADRPATNLTAIASGGQMAVTGDPDREPLKNGGYQAEYQLGLNGFTATLCGLWAAEESGEGDDIDISAVEAMASTLEASLNTYCYLQRNLHTGRRGNVMSAAIGLYPCEDGQIGVHAMPRNWPALARLMDAEWALTDPRFKDAASRLANDDELRALIYAWASDKSKKEVYERAGQMRAPVAYVHTMEDLLNSPHLRERQYFRTIEHPLAGELEYPRSAIRMTETPDAGGRAPLLGEHTDQVLRELLDLTTDDINVLRGHGVI